MIPAFTQRFGRPVRSRPGQGLVEFALLLPILLLLIMGILEFARAWNVRHVVTDAAREGARNLVVRDMTAAEVEALVSARIAAAGLDPENATIDAVACAGGACTSPTVRIKGEPARVSIQYPFQLGVVGVLLGWAVPDRTVNIRTTFVMRNE
jgi:Flp pilus assembly protein TadG